MTVKAIVKKIISLLYCPMSYMLISYVLIFLIFLSVVTDSHAISFSNSSSENISVSPKSVHFCSWC